VTDDIVDALQDTYRMCPTQALPELPSTGMRVSRWRRAMTGLTQVMHHPRQTYILSLILTPMRARAWLGSSEIWSGPIRANTIRLTPPNRSPTWQTDTPFDFLLLTIPSQTIDRIAGSMAVEIHETLRTTFPLYVRDQAVFQYAQQMMAAGRNRNRWALHIADGLGLAMIAHLLAHYGDSGEGKLPTGLSPSCLRRVTKFIADHMTDDIHVSDLAIVAGLCESYFAHAFRASTGLPPHRFIMSQRIERARLLLASNGMSVSEVGLDCGFKDASHFARVFRAHAGVSPGSYRVSN